MPPTDANAANGTPAKFCLELDADAVRVIETLIGQPFTLLSAMHVKHRLEQIINSPDVTANPAAATKQPVTFQLGEIAGAVGYIGLGMRVANKFAEAHVRDILRRLSEGN